jgi:hypothetical protein
MRASTAFRDRTPPSMPAIPLALAVLSTGGALAAPHAPLRPEALRTWAVVGSGPATANEVMSPYLELSPQGVPHLAYQDLGVAFSRLSLRRWDSAAQAWIDAIAPGSGSVAQSWYNRFVFGSDGAMWHAAREYQQPTATVHRLGPTGWSALPLGASLGDAHYVDIDLLPDGRPVVVTQDASTNPVNRTVVRVLDGQAWRTLGDAPASPGTASYQSIAVRRDGTVLCAYSDATAGGRPVIKRFDALANQWLDCGPPNFSLENAANLVLEIGPDGSPWLAWTLTFQKISVWRLEAAGWRQVGGEVDGTDTPVVATENWRQWMCLRFDAQGRPWTAYQAANAQGRATVKRFEDQQWRVVGAPAFTPHAADYLTFTLGPDGTPWVAFRDGLTRRGMVMAWR